MTRKFLHPAGRRRFPSRSRAGSAFAASSFDVSELDKTINPCADFNGFVNAKWVAANPIPADRTRWGAFDQLREHSLEHAARDRRERREGRRHAKAGSIEQKIGWFYRSGMDDAAIDKAGFDPIKPDLASDRRAEDRPRTSSPS